MVPSSVLPLTVETNGMSAALDVSAASAVVGVIMPASWSPAVVTVQGSIDGTEFFDIYAGPAAGELFFNVMADALVPINPDRLRGCKAIKLRSGFSGAVIPQAQPRLFGIVVEGASAAGGGTLPETGYYGTKLNWADGAGAIALPNWLPAPFVQVDGPHGVLEGSGFRCVQGGPVVLVMNGYVKHQWDRWIIFGRRWDGGAIVEFARLQIKSNEPVLVYFEMAVTLEQGGLLETFISSDFEWASFAWSNGAMMLLVESLGSFARA